MADDSTTTDTAPPLTVHKKFDNAAPATPQQGGRNYLRVCKLIASDNSGSSTLDLSGLRIRFQTVSHTVQSPSLANIVVSNASQATFSTFQKEFTKVSLFCGYEGMNPGLVFSGTITETQYGEREGYTDPLLRITARDGDPAYNQGILSKTLAAGWTHMDVVNASLDAWKPFGITLGQIIGVDLTTKKFPRGISLSGMVRDHMRDLALSNRATWNLNGGKLNIISKDAGGTGGPILLNSQTGMVGQPIQRTEGIIVRCLINSAITVDSRVQIDQRSIVQTTVRDINVDTTGADAELQNQLSSQGVADGIYRVLQVATEGDTRGPPWFMDLTLLGATTGSLSKTQAGLGFK